MQTQFSSLLTIFNFWVKNVGSIQNVDHLSIQLKQSTMFKWMHSNRNGEYWIKWVNARKSKWKNREMGGYVLLDHCKSDGSWTFDLQFHHELLLVLYIRFGKWCIYAPVPILVRYKQLQKFIFISNRLFSEANRLYFQWKCSCVVASFTQVTVQLENTMCIFDCFLVSNDLHSMCVTFVVLLFDIALW